jgi:hypothetical protein
MYLFKIDDEVRLNNRPLGKVPVLSDAVLLAKIWKPRERAGEERSTPGKSGPVSTWTFSALTRSGAINSELLTNLELKLAISSSQLP